ncbi:MAG: DUF3990 domain-containing protein [Lachnospiraceae bacterium]|nr:DUF3990 domain-containing protein [Lachnospiraceae bacterium]
MSRIEVYHGSGMEVKKPSLEYGRYDADFGIGFYVTQDYEMAEKWAAIKKTSVINVYELDLDNLNGIEFGLDKSWLDFIVQNRIGSERINIDITDVDYIIGATADDKLFSVIEQYEDNLIDVDSAVKAMNAMKIGKQISLCSEKAVTAIQFTSSHMVTDERKEELSVLRKQARRETNEIVERILKERVKEKNEKPGPAPKIHRRR